MAQHFIHECKHGFLVAQCRCPGHKQVVIVDCPRWTSDGSLTHPECRPITEVVDIAQWGQDKPVQQRHEAEEGWYDQGVGAIPGDSPVRYQPIGGAPDNKWPIAITRADGTPLVRIANSGEVELPNPALLTEASAHFWTKVIQMAEAFGITVCHPQNITVDYGETVPTYGPTSDDPRTHIPDES